MGDGLRERTSIDVGDDAASVPPEEGGGLRDAQEFGYHLDHERFGIHSRRAAQGSHAATFGRSLRPEVAQRAVPAPIAEGHHGARRGTPGLGGSRR